MDVRGINILVLAYLGDAVYETYIREFLINKSIANVNDLQKESQKYVSARAQACVLKTLIEDDVLNEYELEIVKRGRNAKISRHPKNCDILTYKHASAFEALIGHLHFCNKEERIKEIIEYVVKGDN